MENRILTRAEIKRGYLDDIVHARVPVEHRGPEVRAPVWAVLVLDAAHTLPAMRRALACLGLRRARVDARYREGIEVVQRLGGTEALATYVAAADAPAMIPLARRAPRANSGRMNDGIKVYDESVLVDGNVPGELIAPRATCVVEAKTGIFKVYYRGLFGTCGTYNTGIAPSRNREFAIGAAERLQSDRAAMPTTGTNFIGL